MPNLGDLIGAMMADAMRARVQADIEAVRIAEMYSRNELLRHLPVPHFRLPDVVIDVPVLVSGGPRPRAESASVAPTDDQLREVVSQTLKTHKITLPRGEAVRSGSVAVDRLKVTLSSESQPILTHNRISQDVARSVVDHVRSVAHTALPEPTLQALESTLRTSLSSLILAKIPSTPALEVVADSEQIRAHDDPASIVRVRLTISEEGYEMVAHDDDSGYTLTPE